MQRLWALRRRAAMQQEDNCVYLIDGQGLLQGEGLYGCAAGSGRPNGLGFSRMAKGIGAVTGRPLLEKGINYYGLSVTSAITMLTETPAWIAVASGFGNTAFPNPLDLSPILL